MRRGPSTKRLVESLEYVIVPRKVNAMHYVETRLEEREREDFFRLKLIKKKLEAESA